MPGIIRFLLYGLAAPATALALAGPEAGGQRVRCGTRTTAPCSAPGMTLESVSAGQFHSCGVMQDGSAWCWGDGRQGALGDGQRDLVRLPRRVAGPLRFVEVGAGGEFSCARSVDDAVHCWGHSQAVPGWPRTPDVPVRVPFDGAVRFLTVGRRHACLLDGDGEAHCWGFNVDGETGTGTGGIDGAMVAAPSPVATDQRFRMLSAGLGFTCGVTVGGEVLCWGSNIDWIIGPEAPDRCGDVTPIPCAKRPVAVPLPEPATMVSSGTGHACAVTVGGTVFCWGSNGSGQVGAYNAAVPRVRDPAAVSVSRSGPFIMVSSGGILTCALASSRKVYCWGADQLHLGKDIDPTAAAPRVAAGGTQFRSISAGSLHACGIDTRGRVLCWGDTIRGALGAR